MRDSRPSVPLYTYSQQRNWKKVTIIRVCWEFCKWEWSHWSSLIFTWILLAVNACPSTYFHSWGNKSKWGTKTKTWNNIKNTYYEKKGGNVLEILHFTFMHLPDTFTVHTFSWNQIHDRIIVVPSSTVLPTVICSEI